MSRLAKRLRNLIPELEYSQETHRQWAEYFEHFPEEYDRQPALGDAKHHRRCVAIYEERIQAVTEAAQRLEALEGSEAPEPGDTED